MLGCISNDNSKSYIWQRTVSVHVATHRYSQPLTFVTSEAKGKPDYYRSRRRSRAKELQQDPRAIELQDVKSDRGAFMILHVYNKSSRTILQNY